MFSSQRYQVASWNSGRIFKSPLRTAATALAAMVLQFTYHWGVIIGSIISPEREHKPSLILFGSFPRNNPNDVRACSMAIRASYLIIPRKWMRRGLGWEMTRELAAVISDLSVASEDDADLEVMSLATGVIIRIVGWSDLHSTSPKFHFNKDSICGMSHEVRARNLTGNDGNLTINKGVLEVFAMEVEVSVKSSHKEARLGRGNLGSLGWTATAVSPSIVSNRVVAITSSSLVSLPTT